MIQGVWMHEEEKAVIEKYLNPDVTMMEWGSGGSTIEFSKQVKKYYSVEHNWEWYNKVNNVIKLVELNKQFLSQIILAVNKI